MSATYTLHVGPDFEAGDPAALDRAELVRDGFAWGALLVPMLWFFAHRHLWLGLGAAAIVGGLAGGLWLAGLSTGTIVLAEILLHLLIGLEGSSLRRWAYRLRHRPAVDLVVAATTAEAEAKSFARWLGPADPPAPRRPPAGSARLAGSFHEPVIGLFPDLEGRHR